MLVLSENLVIAKNSLSTQYPWLLLLELHVNDDADTIHRWVQNYENVTFDGEPYTGFNFELDMITYKGGEVPQAALRISHVTQFLKADLEANRGCTSSQIVLMIVHANQLTEDYAELTLNWDVIAARITAKFVEFRLGGPSPLRRRVPPDRYYADSCRFLFESARCGYVRKSMADVTLTGTDPVSIEVTTHGFETDDMIRIADAGGITPSLDGSYVITKTDANNFTLNGTDSSDYSGPYTGGGTAGYAACSRLRSDCRDRENEVRFGGFPGLRAETIRLA